jgi:hypothetical protein
MFDSLNYLTAQRDLLKALRKTKQHLNPRGIFIFDMNTFEGLQDNWRRTSVIEDAGMSLIVQTSFDEKRARGKCLMTGFIKKGQTFRKFQEEHIERGYRATEIDELLQRASFAYKKFDGYTFGRPKKRSGRLFYLCFHAKR